MNFHEFYKLNKTDIKTHSDYCGILKKDHPKWMGWALIKKHKNANTNIQDIEDETLNILIETFYLIQYTKEKYIKEKN